MDVTFGSPPLRSPRWKFKKCQGGQEFVFDNTPESETLDEDELIERFNAEYNRHGLWYRYEAKRIDYYWEPTDIKFVDGKFTME